MQVCYVHITSIKMTHDTPCFSSKKMAYIHRTLKHRKKNARNGFVKIKPHSHRDVIRDAKSIEANIDALKRNETKSKMFDNDASTSDVEDYFSEQE